jgi:hypothetical protein
VQSAESTGSETDGLAELDKRRQRRRPLAPRNPRPAPSPAAPSAPVVDLTETPTTEAGEKAEADPEVTPETSRPRPGAAKTAGRRPQDDEQAKLPKQEETGPEPLRLAQFYVTPAIDKYLRAVRAEALTQDLDVTASAVARMALQRLADETTPQELVRQLGEPKKGKARGRPRR